MAKSHEKFRKVVENIQPCGSPCILDGQFDAGCRCWEWKWDADNGDWLIRRKVKDHEYKERW